MFKTSDGKILGIVNYRGEPKGSRAAGYSEGYDKGKSDATPSGSIEITENGTYDVAQYAEATVNVEGGGSSDAWNAYCFKTGEHFDLPEGMTEIWSGMFGGQSDLKTVNIPETVTSIGSLAFGTCTKLQVNQLPSKVATIMDRAYFCCWENKAVVFSQELDWVDSMAFYDNDELTEVTFVCTANYRHVPRYIAYDVFAGCDKLEKINVFWSEGEVEGEPWGANNATINYNYWDAANIPEVFYFPQGFVKIPDELFRNRAAVKVKEIYLGDECEVIGGFAFQKLLNLETVYFPDGLKKIGQYAFRYDTALKFSELPDSIEELDTGAFRASGVPLTRLPSNLQKIKTRAFAENPNIMIEEIPASVYFIGNAVFERCTGLKKIKFLGTPQSGIPASTFSGCSNITEISVPFSADHPYAANAPWGAENATIIYDWKEE